jgi:hypothetical protein
LTTPATASQVERVHVAACCVAGLWIVLRLEQHIAQLRDVAEQLVATDGTRGRDELVVDYHHRQRLGGNDPLDARTDNRDFLQIIDGCGRGALLREQRRAARGNQETAGTGQSRPVEQSMDG